MKISDLIPNNARAAVIARHAHMSTETLRERLAAFERNGKAALADIAKGDKGDFAGTVVRKGQHVASYTKEACANVNRRAWAETRLCIMARETA